VQTEKSPFRSSILAQLPVFDAVIDVG